MRNLLKRTRLLARILNKSRYVFYHIATHAEQVPLLYIYTHIFQVQYRF